MNTIDVLIEGYANLIEKGWDASSTCVLITTDSGLKIIADPGANRDLLCERLNQHNLSVNDINMVFITHHHLDHAMNVGIFPNAKIIDNEAIYMQSKAVEGVEKLPGTDIAVLQTPGHESTHASLIVPTKDGTVVVAGDCFWWTSEQEQKVGIHQHDMFAEEMEQLKESRKKILAIANWVIPGHGKMFKNERKQ